MTMKHPSRILALILALLPAAPAVAQDFPFELPANTVVGRTGLGPGLATAVPFDVLVANLIPANGLSFSQFPTFAASTVLGSISGGIPAPLNQAQLTSLINLATTSLPGSVPALQGTAATYFGGDGHYDELNFAALGGAATLAQFPAGVSDTILGYFGSTGASATLINNCSNALTYSTSMHTFGCNTTGGTGTVIEQKNTASTGLVTSGNCDNTTTNASSPCNYALALNNAVLQASPANPTNTTSTTLVMMGLGSTCKLTPVYSGRIQLDFTGDLGFNGASGLDEGIEYQIFFGTGTAPANGAATTGTALGSQKEALVLGQTTGFLPFSGGGIMTGLTVGTAVWFDIAIKTGLAADPAAIVDLDCSANEF
jgi:hypothetical protein